MEKQKTGQEMAGFYETPMIEVTEIAVEQNILQAASDNNSPRDMPGEYW
ncbi:hypothetical protein [Proteiniphilum sp. UBA5384]|nr:hypothetical protein [Proteiniphilum sp. UBA5384]